MANVLNIKPILTIREGKLDLLERVRTEKRAWSRAIELVGETVEHKAIERLAVVHVASPGKAEQFRQQLCQAVACPEEVLITGLTPGLSVHSGSGIVGAAYVIAP